MTPIARPTADTTTTVRGGIEDVLRRSEVACELVRADGSTQAFGVGEPVFRVRLATEAAADIPLTEWAVGRAYINGEIDFEGDVRAVIGLRDLLPVGMSVKDMAKFAVDLFVRSPGSVNKPAIDDHYTLGDDFYLTFIDERYRFYSHCLFESDSSSPTTRRSRRPPSTSWRACGTRWASGPACACSTSAAGGVAWRSTAPRAACTSRA